MLKFNKLDSEYEDYEVMNEDSILGQVRERLPEKCWTFFPKSMLFEEEMEAILEFMRSLKND